MGIARVLLLTSILGCVCAFGGAGKPNIIVILADDLGYETIGANGGTSYKTPTLDRLAAAGVRFTQCYAQPLCTPTRVQLMTGLSNVRNYVSFGHMDPGSVTFANLLKKDGYATCMVGKWQLGREAGLPKQFGFDEACLWQHTRRPPRYANPGIEFNGVERDFSGGEYGPDIVSDYGLDFIARGKDVPFLLYYSMMLTHAPYQPTPDSKDWDPKARGETVNQSKKHFGDMVEYMDKLVGRLMDRLDALGIRSNTLILFVGDNGTGCGIVSNMGSREMTGGKGTTTVAGMHVPLIVHWPAGARRGVVCDDLVDTTDILPTVLDAAGASSLKPGRLDGRSFLPQLRGERGQPRQWLYSWYSPRLGGSGMEAREFAYDKHYKLYRTGEFYDMIRDPGEKQPLKPGAIKEDAAGAASRLRAALEEYRNARPPELDKLYVPKNAREEKTKARL